MQVGAVVELAGRRVFGDVGHTGGQLHGGDMVEPEFLEPWRVDQRRGARRMAEGAAAFVRFKDEGRYE